MKALYFICHEDYYGQRTGTYEPIWIDPKDISVNRFGFLTWNGRYVYEWEIDAIRACQM